MAASARQCARPEPPTDDVQHVSGFFVLPREIRDEIYTEILVYPHVVSLDCTHLVQTLSAIDGFRSCFSPRLAPPGVVQLNRRVHHEAAAILYSANRFSVDSVEFLAHFLDQIGPHNASLLRHLVIPFPDFHNDDCHAGITLQEDSSGMRALDLILERCHGLVTLETSLSSSHAMEIRLDELDSPSAVDQALAALDARFRAIPLLGKLNVHLYDEPINLAVREKMTGHGWTIETTEHRQSDSDDYDRVYDYDDYGHDSFWDDSYHERDLEEEWWEDFDRRNNSGSP